MTTRPTELSMAPEQPHIDNALSEAEKARERGDLDAANRWLTRAACFTATKVRHDLADHFAALDRESRMTAHQRFIRLF